MLLPLRRLFNVHFACSTSSSPSSGTLRVKSTWVDVRSKRLKLEAGRTDSGVGVLTRDSEPPATDLDSAVNYPVWPTLCPGWQGGSLICNTQDGLSWHFCALHSSMEILQNPPDALLRIILIDRVK